MPEHPLDRHPLRGLFTATGARSARASTWDRTGGNKDTAPIGPGETATLLDVDGPGCITHIYMATGPVPAVHFRQLILRMYWDGESSPSVEVPLGDFFCLSHARIRPIRSHFVVVNPGLGWSYGINCYFPMPFASGARITLENRAPHPSGYLHHVEYDTYRDPLPEDVLRFHAQWRQERPTQAVGDEQNIATTKATNLDGAQNYEALSAEGQGQMVGLHLQVNNLHTGWYGEGDDMVFIDGETWPPSLHGTGTEEIFGGGACPNEEYAGPYTGFHLIESMDYSGLVGMYRWYVFDPIRFTKSIRWTVEHGHANNYANEYTSVVYWYQMEPHADFPALPTEEAMRPPTGGDYAEATEAFMREIRKDMGVWWEHQRDEGSVELVRRMRVADAYYRGDWTGTLKQLKERPPIEGLVRPTPGAGADA